MCALPLPGPMADGTPDDSGIGAPHHVSESLQFTVVVVDKRMIVRECLAQSIQAWSLDVRMLTSVDGCGDLMAAGACDLVVLCGNAYVDVAEGLVSLQKLGIRCPILVIFDATTPDTVIGALDLGARGVLPTSSNLGILNGVIKLLRSGGTYVPPDCMIAAQRNGGDAVTQSPGDSPFTPRQSAIIAAIRKGCPNKIIAYELGMCESTVKVHVRNIMKKLKVRNRTELALKAVELRIMP